MTRTRVRLGGVHGGRRGLFRGPRAPAATIPLLDLICVDTVIVTGLCHVSVDSMEVSEFFCLQFTQGT